MKANDILLIFKKNRTCIYKENNFEQRKGCLLQIIENEMSKRNSTCSPIVCIVENNNFEIQTIISLLGERGKKFAIPGNSFSATDCKNINNVLNEIYTLCEKGL